MKIIDWKRKLTSRKFWAAVIGIIYSMMGIPEDLFTPLFACARMAGWAAHRFEEIASGKRIIRPAYKNTYREGRDYLPIDER